MSVDLSCDYRENPHLMRYNQNICLWSRRKIVAVSCLGGTVALVAIVAACLLFAPGAPLAGIGAAISGATLVKFGASVAAANIFWGFVFALTPTMGALLGAICYLYKSAAFPRDQQTSSLSSVELSPLSSSFQGLENRYQDLICCQLDISRRPGFDFLNPNERNPEMIVEHFRQIPHCEKGVCIATGTERLIFDLLLGNFQAVIGVDIEPRAKAYLDFLILLGRISDDRAEFCRLAEDLSEASFEDERQSRIAAIIEKIELSSMPRFMKDYYRMNIDSFSMIFYRTRKLWKNDASFDAVNYYKNDELFNKFQRYAEQGRIISTWRDINQLQVFDDLVVKAIDVSNIWNFALIDLEWDSRSTPRVIWTRVSGQALVMPEDPSQRPDHVYSWQYFSYMAVKLAPEQRVAFMRSKEKLQDAHMDDGSSPQKIFCGLFHYFDSHLQKVVHPFDPADPFDHPIPYSTSPKPAQLLEAYIQTNVYDSDELGALDLATQFKQNFKLSRATRDQIERLCQDPDFSRFAPQLVCLMNNYFANYCQGSDDYTVFASIAGWKRSFETFYSENPQDLKKILYQLKTKNILREFLDRLRESEGHWSPDFTESFSRCCEELQIRDFAPALL